MTTIEKVTVKFSDGSEIEMTKDQFEELKRSFKKPAWYTSPDTWSIHPWYYPNVTWTTYTVNNTFPKGDTRLSRKQALLVG